MDVGVYVLGSGAVAGTPHRAEDHLVRAGLTRVTREEGQDLELLGCEGDVEANQRDVVVHEVTFEVRECPSRCVRRFWLRSID